ncbi:hypothetical protein ACH5RR_028379 [Cinchona calisaya]|uniref:Xyloglucan endotransglucosylase/hydrolase n=1 Tax=Cinchona calisaya TaxID=153742 RepID=A0ABD2YNM1_9GENT
MLLISTAMSSPLSASAGNFYQDVDVNWGNQNCRILNSGQLLTLSLDHISASGFQSKNEYIFGRFDMQIKLVPGNSAGILTTFFKHGKVKNLMPLTEKGLDGCKTSTEFTTVVLQGRGLLKAYLLNANVRGFQSKDQYLFGRVDVQLKLVPGDSAGTVTAFYLSSQEPAHDEIDFEFLGNVSGEPYIVHTNIYTEGHAGREQQFYMWFDPTRDFHTYSIIWNPQRVIFLVDDIPIRVYTNHESLGVPYPSRKPMRLYSSIWNADSWATQGGKVKIDWRKAPFTASYRNLKIDACVWPSTSSCESTSSNSSPSNTRMTQQLDAGGKMNLQWVQKNYMVYNYCTDFEKFVHGIPLECRL